MPAPRITTPARWRLASALQVRSLFREGCKRGVSSGTRASHQDSENGPGEVFGHGLGISRLPLAFGKDGRTTGCSWDKCRSADPRFAEKTQQKGAGKQAALLNWVQARAVSGLANKLAGSSDGHHSGPSISTIVHLRSTLVRSTRV